MTPSISGAVVKRLIKQFTFLLLISFTLSALASVPVAPLELTIKDSSGKAHKIYPKGTIHQQWTETANGYTVQLNSGKWYYASLVNGELVASHYEIGSLKDTELKTLFTKHIKPQFEEIIIQQKPQQETLEKSSGLKFRPSETDGHLHPVVQSSKSINNLAKMAFNQNLLVIEVSFNDVTIQNSAGGNSIQSAFFGATNSIKEFYSKNFNNNFILQPATESQGTSNDGIVNVTLNINHPNSGLDFNSHTTNIVTPALQAIDQYVDFSTYDANTDGTVDPTELAVFFVIAGYEQAYGGSASSEQPNVYALKSGMSDVTLDGIVVNQYALAGEIHSVNQAPQNAHRFTIGLVAHELGHLLFGLPDLYDDNLSNGNSAGIGEWGLMASGSWNSVSGNIGSSPAYMTAWSKDVSGHSFSNEITSTGLISLAPNEARKVWLDKYEFREAFYLENRQLIDYDAALPGEGILLTHADNVVFGNGNVNNKNLDVEAADGLTDLDELINYGESGDLFPGTSVNSEFDGATNPNSNDKSDAASGIDISGITINGDTAEFNVDSIRTNGFGTNITYAQDRFVGTIGFGSTTVFTLMHFTNNTIYTSLDGIELFAVSSGTVKVYLYSDYSQAERSASNEIYSQTTPIPLTSGWNRILLDTKQTLAENADIYVVLEIVSDSSTYPAAVSMRNFQNRSFLSPTARDSGYYLISFGEFRQRLLLGEPPPADTDGDGMTDDWENQYSLNPNDPADAALDADNDELSNLDEFNNGTNPTEPDTDADGMTDGFEVGYGLDPLVDDAALDLDTDGLTNIQEFNLGTDPDNQDTDSDGLSDSNEVDLGINPLSIDSDNDGMTDLYEVNYQLDLFANDSTADADSDGLTNIQEFQLGTNPQSEDTDNDGLTDLFEISNGYNPLVPDADSNPMTPREKAIILLLLNGYDYRSEIERIAFDFDPSSNSIGVVEFDGNDQMEFIGQKTSNGAIEFIEKYNITNSKDPSADRTVEFDSQKRIKGISSSEGKILFTYTANDTVQVNVISVDGSTLEMELPYENSNLAKSMQKTVLEDCDVQKAFEFEPRRGRLVLSCDDAWTDTTPLDATQLMSLELVPKDPFTGKKYPVRRINPILNPNSPKTDTSVSRHAYDFNFSIPTRKPPINEFKSCIDNFTGGIQSLVINESVDLLLDGVASEAEKEFIKDNLEFCSVTANSTLADCVAVKIIKKVKSVPKKLRAESISMLTSIAVDEYTVRNGYDPTSYIKADLVFKKLLATQKVTNLLDVLHAPKVVFTQKDVDVLTNDVIPDVTAGPVPPSLDLVLATGRDDETSNIDAEFLVAPEFYVGDNLLLSALDQFYDHPAEIDASSVENDGFKPRRDAQNNVCATYQWDLFRNDNFYGTVTTPPGKEVQISDIQSGEYELKVTARNDQIIFDVSAERTFEKDKGALSQPSEISGKFTVKDLQCEKYDALVPGMWKVGSPEDFANGTALDAEFFADGTGVYRYPDRDYGFSWSVHPWDEPLRAPWSVTEAPYRPLGVEPGCLLYDTGFWHFSYNGLIRSNLQEPLIGFSKYQLGGPFDQPPFRNYFGYDLSTAVEGVRYEKQ